MARNKYPEKTVNSILERSEELFKQNGYYGTSMQDIIDAISPELTKGAVYHHFKNKSEIFRAVFREMVESLVEEVSPVINLEGLTGANKYDRLGAAVHNSASYARILDFIRCTNQNADGVNGTLASVMKVAAGEVLVPNLTGLFEEGIRDGSIACDNAQDLAEATTHIVFIWITGMVGLISEEEFARKLRIVNRMFEPFGLHPIDEKVLVASINE